MPVSTSQILIPNFITASVLITRETFLLPLEEFWNINIFQYSIKYILIFVCIYICIWASLVAKLVKNLLQCRRHWFDSWVGKMPWRRDRLLTPVFLCFPGGSDGKESTCNAGDLGLIPRLGRTPREGNGYLLQNSCLGNLMDRGDWQATVLGVADSQIQLSN